MDFYLFFSEDIMHLIIGSQFATRLVIYTSFPLPGVEHHLH